VNQRRMTIDKVQVLIVEDDAIVAMELRYGLEALGYSVPADISLGEAGSGVDSVHLPAQPNVHQHQCWARAKLTEPFGYLMKPLDPKELQSVLEVTIYNHRIDRRLKERTEWTLG